MAKQLTEVPRCEGCNRPVFGGVSYCQACRDKPVAPIPVPVEPAAPVIPDCTTAVFAPPGTDLVNHPPHYQSANGIESIDAIEAAPTPEEFRGFCKGNALKYCWREKHKGGDQDLAKAAWYLNRLQKEAR